MDLEKYKDSTPRELRWMIRITKFFRFFSTRKGEFLLGFVCIVGIQVLIFGFNIFVILFAMFIHALYSIFLLDLVRKKYQSDEDYKEYTIEIETYRKLLKEKLKK